jgi:hypothetical protein
MIVLRNFNAGLQRLMNKIKSQNKNSEIYPLKNNKTTQYGTSGNTL